MMRIRTDLFRVSAGFVAVGSRIRLFAGGGAIVVSLACSGGGGDAVPYAGEGEGYPMLVVSSATIANLPVWRLGPDPLRIGEGNAGRDHVLDQAGMPWRMSDGDIIVPN